MSASDGPGGAGGRGPAGGGNGQALGLGQHLVSHPPGDPSFEHPHLARRLAEDDLAAQLAAVFLEVGLGADCDADDIAVTAPLRARRPRLGIADERLPLRLQQMRLEARQRPALPELPLLGLRVGQAPVAQPLDGPVGGLIEPRRAGEARAVHIRQPADVVHHLRATEAFVLNSREQRVVERVLRPNDDGRAERGDDEREYP